MTIEEVKKLKYGANITWKGKPCRFHGCGSTVNKNNVGIEFVWCTVSYFNVVGSHQIKKRGVM